MTTAGTTRFAGRAWFGALALATTLGASVCANAQSTLTIEPLRYRPAGSAAAAFVRVPGLEAIRDVTIGDQHACALARDGSVRCWGTNRVGQLGLGTRDDHETPVVVTGLTDVVQLVAGEAHTCARTSDGALRCWGSNAYGQIDPNRVPTSVPRPAAVPGLANVVDVASAGNSVCAVVRDGTVRCWGANFAGQLGDGSRVDPRAVITVHGLVDAVEIAMGGNATCARRRNGLVTCWGADDRGQLGIGPYVEQNAPARTVPLHDVTGIVAGDYFACARASRGQVHCWGEVGNDGTHGFTATPVLVHDASGRVLDDVVAMSARGNRACFVRHDASAVCFDVAVGANARPIAYPVVGTGAVARVALRPPMACVVSTDGHARCAGPASEPTVVPMPSPARR